MVSMTVILPVVDSGGTLWLRPWRFDDLSALIFAHEDVELRRWLSLSLADEGRARQWLDAQAAGWAAATRFSFAVVSAADDRTPVGHVAVTVGNAGVGEVGYWTAASARG